MSQFRTNARQFQVFEREAKRCLKAWGLNGWDVDFQHERLRPDGRVAQCNTAIVARHATLSLGKVHSQPPTDAYLRECAKHEAAHVLLAPVADLARARWVTEDEVCQAVEAVVNRLSGLLP